MRNNVIGKLITILLICFCTIEIGISLGFYFIVNMDFNRFNNEVNTNILR